MHLMGHRKSVELGEWLALVKRECRPIKRTKLLCNGGFSRPSPVPTTHTTRKSSGTSHVSHCSLSALELKETLRSDMTFQSAFCAACDKNSTPLMARTLGIACK